MTPQEFRERRKQLRQGAREMSRKVIIGICVITYALSGVFAFGTMRGDWLETFSCVNNGGNTAALGLAVVPLAGPVAASIIGAGDLLNDGHWPFSASLATSCDN